jgi:hypothetical protein
MLAKAHGTQAPQPPPDKNAGARLRTNKVSSIGSYFQKWKPKYHIRVPLAPCFSIHRQQLSITIGRMDFLKTVCLVVLISVHAVDPV